MKNPINQSPQLDAIGRRFPDLPQSTGRNVELRANDIKVFQFYHRHGDLPTAITFQYLNALGLAKNLQATVRRHGLLFHEKNTPHNGPYLARDPNQWQTKNSDYHPLVHRTNSRSDKVLEAEGLYTKNTPKPSISWKHDFLRACYSASIEIACLREPDKYEYIHHDEIVDRIGKDIFSVEGKTFRPDLIHGIRYKANNTVRLFMVEIDCKTEQVRSTAKNPYRTFENKLEVYRKYISGGLYKDDFKISGGLMLTVVTVNRGHLNHLMKLVKKPTNYMLFNFVDNFDYGFIPPSDIFTLFSDPWLRPGLDDFYMNNPD